MNEHLKFEGYVLFVFTDAKAGHEGKKLPPSFGMAEQMSSLLRSSQ